MDFLNNIYTKISTAVTTGVQHTVDTATNSAAAKVTDLFKGVETGAVAVINPQGKITPPATSGNVLAPLRGNTAPVMGLAGVAVIAVLAYLVFRK